MQNQCTHHFHLSNTVILCKFCGVLGPNQSPPTYQPFIQGNSNLCIYCNKNPKNQNHNYCGKTCAKNHSQNTIINPPPNNSHSINSNLCIYCNKNPKYQNHNYCGKTCANMKGSVTNSPSKNQSQKYASFQDLQKTDTKKYQDIKKQFEDKWTHTNKPKPTKIVSILKITPPSNISSKFETYKQNVIKNRPTLKLFGLASKGNTVRRFHGTTLVKKKKKKFFFFLIIFSNKIKKKTNKKIRLAKFIIHCPLVTIRIA